MNYHAPDVSVLIVEDSPLVRRRIRNMLIEIEQVRSVREAEDAWQAIEACDAQEPDYLILDLRLAHGTSGLDVLRHVKAKAYDCVTIMLTNVSLREVREECISLGADHFFNKATEFERVMDVVARPKASMEAQAR